MQPLLTWQNHFWMDFLDHYKVSKEPLSPEYETVEVFDGEKWVLVRKTQLEPREEIEGRN